MGMLFPRYGGLVTGGAIGDGLFFFCSGFTLFLGRKDDFPNWYKRRVNRIYPTIIMWALLSSLFFRWDWSVPDLITTPRYWFIPCIMVYYVIFYIIREYFMEHLKLITFLSFAVVAASSLWLLDYSQSVMYAHVPFMRVYYFLFMLQGAMVALAKRPRTTSLLRSCSYALVSLVLYYACMAAYKCGPFYCRFQLLSLLPLLSLIYWIYVSCDTPSAAKVFDCPRTGKAVNFISGLTLEVYMVQYAVFTDRLNGIFPLNIVLTFIAIFLAAYLLKCASRLFSQVFSEQKMDWKLIYRI